MPKIGIFIPCYNVEKSVGNVLRSFSADTISQVDEIVVGDNKSTDNTLQTFEQIRSESPLLAKKLVVIKNGQNYGLGGTQKIAYQYFLNNQFTNFMIIHGDNQGDGEQIAQSFLDTFREQPGIDLIIASRFTKGSDTSKYDFMRLFGNHVFNWLTFFLTGHMMTDSGAAILFIRTEILKDQPFWHLTNSFQFNPQLNILFYNDKVTKAEVPMIWRDSESESNITAMNYCMTLLTILVRYRINKSILRKKGWNLFYNESQSFKPSIEVVKPEEALR